MAVSARSWVRWFCTMSLHDPGSVVIARPAPDAEGLGHGDLDAVDAVPVPEGLEERVGEPEHQEVLDGLLAEVVVDPVDLFFLEIAVHESVELPEPSPGRARTAFR